MNEQNLWWRQGKEPPRKGKKHTPEARAKMKAARATQVLKPWSEESKDKLRKSMEKYREYYSDLFKGEKTHLWKGGITPVNALIRTTSEFKVWRVAVFVRDNRTCQKCKVHDKHIQAHHIQTFSQNEELRFNVDNGITLCFDCHVLFHQLYGKQDNTYSQIFEFLKEIGI